MTTLFRCLRTLPSETLVFDITVGTHSALEVELARRLQAAEDEIDRLKEQIEDNDGLVSACHRRGLWTYEDIAMALPLAEEVPA